MCVVSLALNLLPIVNKLNSDCLIKLSMSCMSSIDDNNTNVSRYKDERVGG